MDFNALQHKLFALDPSDPAEDLRKLAESAGGMPQESVPITESLAQESVEVQQGTMPIEGDYSLSDFAALAGVTLNESQKTGSAGQLKGKDVIKKNPAGTTKNPTKDKLVGEDEVGKVMDPNYTVKKAAEFKKWLGATPSNSKKDKTVAPKKQTSVATIGDYQSFLKQHTVQLKQISADRQKKAEFDKFMAKMAEEIKTPVLRPSTDNSVESIKDMLYRKLNDKK